MGDVHISTMAAMTDLDPHLLGALVAVSQRMAASGTVSAPDGAWLAGVAAGWDEASLAERAVFCSTMASHG